MNYSVGIPKSAVSLNLIYSFIDCPIYFSVVMRKLEFNLTFSSISLHLISMRLLDIRFLPTDSLVVYLSGY